MSVTEKKEKKIQMNGRKGGKFLYCNVDCNDGGGIDSAVVLQNSFIFDVLSVLNNL